MKKLLSILSIPLLISYEIQADDSRHEAVLVYQQGFETPVEQNPEIQWITPGYPVTQAIVTHQSKEGSKSVRGNFNPNITDPVTKMKGEPFTQFKINFNKLPSVKKYLAENDRVYVSWWYKLDACLWKGTDFPNTDPLQARMKFAYIRQGENPSTSYYFAFQGGKSGIGVFQANLDDWISFWQKTYSAAALWTQTGHPYGPDGKWHKISFFINRDPSTKQLYLMWLMDDKLMTKDRYEPDGKYKIVDGFKMDSIQFWITNRGNLNNSEESNIPDNYCNGWQIDDVQIWSNMPANPLPPKVISPRQ
jgi:hypothetical protein